MLRAEGISVKCLMSNKKIFIFIVEDFTAL